MDVYIPGFFYWAFYVCESGVVLHVTLSLCSQDVIVSSPHVRYVILAYANIWVVLTLGGMRCCCEHSNPIF